MSTGDRAVSNAAAQAKLLEPMPARMLRVQVELDASAATNPAFPLLFASGPLDAGTHARMHAA